MISQQFPVTGDRVCRIVQENEKFCLRKGASAYPRAFFVMVFVLFSFACFAQQSSSGFVDSVRQRYEKMATPFLFNGFEYVRYDTHVYKQEFPYFRKPAMAPGEIWYDGRYFTGRTLLYDEVKEQVVIPADYSPGLYGQIALLSERVDSFNIHGLQFLHLKDSTKYRPGFYARMHQGRKGVLYARFLKNLEKGVVTQDGVWDVIMDASYFEWESNGVFLFMRTQADLSRALQVKRGQVKRYIRSQGLEFRKDREAAMVAAVQHFDPQ